MTKRDVTTATRTLETLHELPDTLRRVRKARKHSIRKVALLIHVDYGSLSQFENRKAGANLGRLVKVLEYIATEEEPCQTP